MPTLRIGYMFRFFDQRKVVRVMASGKADKVQTPIPRERGRIAIRLLGYFFLILGVVGLVLPFLQGILFILVGLTLLSRTTIWAGRARAWLLERFPRAGALLVEAELRAMRWIDRITGHGRGGGPDARH